MTPLKRLPYLVLFLALTTLNAQTEEDRFNRLKPEAIEQLRAYAGQQQASGEMAESLQHFNEEQRGSIFNNAADRLEMLDYARVLELTNELPEAPSLTERITYLLRQNQEEAIEPEDGHDLGGIIQYTETITRSITWLALLHQLQPQNIPESLTNIFYIGHMEIDLYSRLIHYLHLFYIQAPPQSYIIFILLTYPIMDASNPTL